MCHPIFPMLVRPSGADTKSGLGLRTKSMYVRNSCTRGIYVSE
jgi:hypothetical protein